MSHSEPDPTTEAKKSKPAIGGMVIAITVTIIAIIGVVLLTGGEDDGAGTQDPDLVEEVAE